MADSKIVVSRVTIMLDGAPLAKEVLAKLTEVVVDQHAHLPSMFTVSLRDPDLKLLDEGPFDLAKQIEIKAELVDGKSKVLINGEITALEPDFEEGMNAALVVRGYDKSHRLYRQTKSKTYLNIKDSDLATQIAQANGLQAEVDSTAIVYDHLYQNNQSDLAFLAHRAWRIGFECFVEKDKLFFRKPPNSAAEIELTWGQDLISFMPRMTVAEQVSQVVVKGWDAAKLEAITGKADKGKLYPQIQETKDGAAWAQSFGSGETTFLDQPPITQEEANTLAAARLDEISGAFVEAEGLAFRHPDIKAGQPLKLLGLGKRFSGTYLVTSALHRYTPDGLTTTFSVRGTRTGLLAEHVAPSGRANRWPGLVPAVVTNTDDPKNWSRVKVKFPWMSDQEESDWARVVGMGAGPEAGLHLLPAVNDEVLVGFIQGDFGGPVVIGGFWNGKYAQPPEIKSAPKGEKPLVRTWHSRTGHWLAMYDNKDNKVEIVTAGGQKIVIDDANKKITIAGTQDMDITVKGKLKVTSDGDLTIESKGSVSIQAGSSMDLQASGQVNVKGSTINLN